MNIIKDVKKSKTIKSCWLKMVGGIVTIIIANLGYFEGAVEASVFGSITIGFSVLDYVIRLNTDKALRE